MSPGQREKWNQRYAERGPDATAPCPWLATVESLLPPAGTALDVAGGAGRHAVWLAQRGLTVTIADIADAGLELARRTAAAGNLAISTVAVDLESEPLPAGPWDVILNTAYLHRPLMTQFTGHLKPGGVLVVVHPTHANLERHRHPGARFLLEKNELPTLIRGLDIVRYEEGWLDGRHEARLVARKP
ncbi:MAG: methyltransferase domain-containing protein [Lentisphaeria bacterium]|jgi:SAM-dependent methyltransferase|nr:methyltransferase domain-containing protein [Lentisphaeria bacterium]MDP7740957.1 methyltransferase domain-containing protein [Lentisphaeria bacterium]